MKVEGRARRRFARSEADAKRKLRELLRSVDAGLPITSGSLTVGAVIDQWETKVLAGRGLEGGTIGQHRWACTVWRDEIGTKRLAALTPEMVEAALQRRADGNVSAAPRGNRGRRPGATGGLSKESCRKLRLTLRQVLAWAERRGQVARNVAMVAELPTTARPAVARRSMTLDEAQAFLAAAEGSPLEAYWLLLLYLGVRSGEAAGLAWQDVDFDNGIIHVRQARKLDAHGAAVIGEPKTPWSVRSLDAPPTVLDALARHRAAENAKRLAVGPSWGNTAGLVFTSPTGRPTDPAAVRREFDRVLGAAGLDGWVPHELRHSAASLLVDSGVPLEEVADQLGHRDTRMLSRTYRHRLRPTVAGGTAMEAVLRRSSGG